ncbi:hypothetical protein H6F89_28735, partial [Cyanobacteria bacterium FACHB-63]|nr:hypothetical protein [Cyanobacteria bacterium FACHB-63]
MLTLSTVATVATDDEHKSGRLDVLNPSTRIETQFGTDRAVWRLLSLQNRLKQAKSPETRAAIVQAIQDHIRTMALLY